jgi:DNA-binding beta-propeller fold protein YncE
MPDNIKGVCACAATDRLYFTTRSKLFCLDLLTDKTLWEIEPPNGTDRMSITPDGRTIYVPSFEKDTWNVIDAASGKWITEIITKSGAHNTVVSRDGSRMYLGGLKSPLLFVADTATHKVVKEVGRFRGDSPVHDQRWARGPIRLNDCLGFEIGDPKRQSCNGWFKALPRMAASRLPKPRHWPTPDEPRSLVVDAANQRVHVFDNTSNRPNRKRASLRDQPGWITFSLDGKYAYPSTGEVIDTATKKILTALTDEQGREVHSEKMVEIHLREGKPVASGDQFGVGRQPKP